MNLFLFNRMITDVQHKLAESPYFRDQYCKKAAELINAKGACLGKSAGQRGGHPSILPYHLAVEAYIQIQKESETLPEPKLSSYQKLKNMIRELLQKNTNLEREVGQLERKNDQLQAENDKLQAKIDQLTQRINRLEPH